MSLNKFKNKSGMWKTRSIFVEFRRRMTHLRAEPIYALGTEDVVRNGVVYPSLYRLFMSSVDEFDFINTHLGGPSHFNELMKCKWFAEGDPSIHNSGYDKWLEDMRARDESLARKILLEAVASGDVSAAKKLFDISKKPAESKRGRFIKEEAQKEAVKQVEENEFLADTALRLNVIKIRDNI